MSKHVQVLVNGWYGAGNVGDELLLRMLAGWCAEAGAVVRVLSAFPAHTRATHGLEAVDANDLPAVARCMSESDLFVLGGGGLLQTHHAFTLPTLYTFAKGDIASYARPVLMARQMDVPTLLWAQGVGPLDGVEARAIVRDLFSNAPFSSVRDAASLDLLRAIGVSAEVPVAPDPVWALPMPGDATVEDDGTKPRLGIILRPWEAHADWQQAFVRAIRRVVDPKRFRLCWIPFQHGDAGGQSVSDLGFVSSVMSQLDGYEHELISLHDPDEAIQVLRKCERLICMRLHAQILALRLGKPVLCIEYDAKMSHASEMAGVPDDVRLSPAALTAQWEERLASLMSHHPPVADANKVANLEVQALRHREVLHAAIEHSRNHVRDSRWAGGGFDWLGAWSVHWLYQRAAEQEGRAKVLGDLYDRTADANAQLQRTVARQQLELETATKATADAEIELDVQARRVASLQFALDERSRELTQVINSRSWRLTRPLRLSRTLLGSAVRQPRGLMYSMLRSTFRALPESLRRKLDGIRNRLLHLRLTSHDAVSDSAWLELANDAARIAIVPSAFEFDELANQRPINLAKHLAARGYVVVFVAWQWSRGEHLAKSGRWVAPGIWQTNLYDFIDQASQLNKRKDGDSIYFLTLPAPNLVGLHPLLRQRGLAIAYDILDDWQAFSGVGQAPWYSEQHEHEAVVAADAVCAVSPPLAQKFSHLRSDIEVVGNGYTAETLGSDRKFCARPARGSSDAIRIGYFGHLTDAWFDWDIVLEAARRLPQCRFEIIGYGEPEWVRQAAADLPNLTLLGKVRPAELWRHAQHWHVGLAPFKSGTLATAIDPIKVYEYLYLGLPTVCTGIPHLRSLPEVSVVDGIQEFVQACLEKAHENPDYDHMDRCLATTTWEARFDAMLALIASSDLRGLYA